MKKRTKTLGGPGTGKTTCLLDKVDDALQRGIAPSRIAFVSFTNAAADEARNRAVKKFSLPPEDFPHFRTLHSLCFRELGLRRSQVLNHEHLKELGELTGELLDTADATAENNLASDPLLTVDHYARTTCQTLREAWDNHGRELDWFRLSRFARAHELFKLDNGLIDFTDMLSGYAREGRPVDVDSAFVDEAQDLTPLQWEVVHRAFGAVPELTVAGDFNQCQPGGTWITTPSGQIALSQLNPKRDTVISYARRDGAVYQKGYSFQKSSHLYTGWLYEVKADKKSTECTYNHKWIVKWTAEAKASNLRAVYLMRQGDNFRVGWAQLFVHGNFRLNQRANEEQADAIWVLKVFKTKMEAYEYEQITAARYGLPMIPFIARQINRDVTPELIKRVFNAVDSKPGALQCLFDHQLHLDYPFTARGKIKYTRYGLAQNEVVACNLLPGLMRVPVYDGTQTVKWTVSAISKRFVKKLKVYGLNVEKYHTYVADGIVTHNCIHKWAGAIGDDFMALDYEQEVLPVSHRLSQPVFRLSQEIAARMSRPSPTAERSSGRAGVVEWITRPEEIDLTSGTWLLLARTRYQLKALADEAHSQGVGYVVSGRNAVDRSHVRAIQAYEALRADRPIDFDDARLVFAAMGRSWPSVLEDSIYGARDLGLDVSAIWHDALLGIPLDDREYYLSCLRHGEKLTAPPRVRIETIHSAKGLEAENVLLMTDLTYRTQRAYELDPDSEHRVFYVGVTRPREALFLCTPRTQFSYPL